MAVTKLQISPVIVNGIENGFLQWIQRIFLVVVEAKKLFSEKFRGDRPRPRRSRAEENKEKKGRNSSKT